MEDQKEEGPAVTEPSTNHSNTVLRQRLAVLENELRKEVRGQLDLAESLRRDGGRRLRYDVTRIRESRQVAIDRAAEAGATLAQTKVLHAVLGRTQCFAKPVDRFKLSELAEQAHVGEREVRRALGWLHRHGIVVYAAGRGTGKLSLVLLPPVERGPGKSSFSTNGKGDVEGPSEFGKGTQERHQKGTSTRARFKDTVERSTVEKTTGERSKEISLRPDVQTGEVLSGEGGLEGGLSSSPTVDERRNEDAPSALQSSPGREEVEPSTELGPGVAKSANGLTIPAALRPEPEPFPDYDAPPNMRD